MVCDHHMNSQFCFPDQSQKHKYHSSVPPLFPVPSSLPSGHELWWHKNHFWVLRESNPTASPVVRWSSSSTQNCSISKKSLLSNRNHSNLKCSSIRKQNYFSDATKNLISVWKFFLLRGRGKNKSSFDSSLSHRESKTCSVKVIFHFLLWFTIQLIQMWGLILILGSLWLYY